ncbi:hypothetical protein BsWGS_08057 [Bradybaena similaris]
MEQQYLAITMRSLVVAILLAALIGMSTQTDDNMTTTTAATPNTSTTTISTMTTDPNATAATASSSTTSVTTKSTATTLPTTTTQPTPTGNLRPVDDVCLQSYFTCTENEAEFKKGNFCKAFNDKEQCLVSSKNCTAEDVTSIEYVDCEPNVFGTEGNVSTLCQGRITECLSLAVKIDSVKNTLNFKSFFCTNKDEKCFTTTHGSKINAICTDAEFKQAVKIAGCTAAHTVISSALFISLAVFTQRLLYRC